MTEDEDSKIICETITEFEETPSQLWIRFENMDNYEENSDKLFNILNNSDGNDKIVIYLKEEKQKKIMPPSYNVNANSIMLNNLQNVFGKDNVAIV